MKSGSQCEQSRDDYESLLSSSIGIGGFSKVYKVRHKQSKMIYAIKVISKQKILQKNLTHQIRLEVDIQYKLDHDHILKLYDHFEDDTNIYLVLQYCGKG